MQPQPALDPRQHPRRDAGLVVSYRPSYPRAAYDITHTRNISRGGMLLTTARAFAPGARLAIQLNLPLRGSPRRVPGTVEAVGSREIVQGLLYETRLEFVDLDQRSSQIIRAFCAGTTDAFTAVSVVFPTLSGDEGRARLARACIADTA